MTAGDYVIDVTIGAWSATIEKGDATDPAADAVTMDPLHAEWSLSGRYPSQPTPTTATFGLYVPSIATGPTPAQGDRVEITITTPDHDPAATGILPVFDFVGKISDVDAATHDDGLAFSIIATDYTADLAEERVGDAPWPAEALKSRMDDIWAASAFPFVYPAAEAAELGTDLGPDVGARDIDSQPTRQLLEQLFSISGHWAGYTPTNYTFGWPLPQFNPVGVVIQPPVFVAPPLSTWMRPAIGQSVDAAGEVTFPLVVLPGGLPDDPASLPYQVALVGGVLRLVRKAIVPDTSLVAWIPATAIEGDSVKWRQDKASNVNRVRGTGYPFVVNGQSLGSLAAEFADLVSASGPVEEPLDFSGVNQDTDPALQQIQTGVLNDFVWMLLGTHYDASTRWALDTFTVRADGIAAGDQWPRLFNPREHVHIYDQAAGRFVLITDCAAKWNLHDRPDYFGRLIAATLDLDDGRIRWTAQLAHRVPVGAGLEGYSVGAPAHSPITYAQLAAGANPTYAQCGDLTPADLELAEH